MGVFDYFRRRRDRERAIPPSEVPPEVRSPAGAGGEPMAGRQATPTGTGGSEPGPAEAPSGAAGLVELMRLAPMIQRAIKDGTVQIESGPARSIDLRGSGLRDEITAIMREHGIDPEVPGLQGRRIDAGSVGDLQAQILAALARHGVDPGAGGGSVER